MGAKGIKDKSKREKQKKTQLSNKEKRRKQAGKGQKCPMNISQWFTNLCLRRGKEAEFNCSADTSEIEHEHEGEIEDDTRAVESPEVLPNVVAMATYESALANLANGDF